MSIHRVTLDEKPALEDIYATGASEAPLPKYRMRVSWSHFVGQVGGLVKVYSGA